MYRRQLKVVTPFPVDNGLELPVTRATALGDHFYFLGFELIYFFEISLFIYGFGAGVGASILVHQFLNRKRSPKPDHSSESGNIFFTMFGAVALVGVVGAASMTVMKGPVRTMAEVTKRTIAENNMIASGKLAIISATNETNGGDCDQDGHIEPIEFVVASPAPGGGGQLPANLGASLQDPWKTNYGYCVWDHGTAIGTTGVPAGTCDTPVANNRLNGTTGDTDITLAIISAGPDRTFNTTCSNYIDVAPADGSPDTPLVSKTSGSDDLILKYTYAEATASGGGLWNIQGGDPNTAEIGGKNIEIVGDTDTGDSATIGYDSGLGISGVGEFMAIKVDDIYPKSLASVRMQSPLKAQNVAGLPAPSGIGGGDQLIDADGDTIIQVEESADDDTIRFDTLGNERMVISSGGGVGIGKNPSVLLDVNGRVMLGGNIDDTLMLQFDGNGYTGTMGMDLTGMRIGHNSGSRNIAFQTNSTDRLVIDGSGLVTATGNIRADGRYYYFGANQYLLGDDLAALYFRSNHSTLTEMIFEDKEGTAYGGLLGFNDGATFGLIDGDLDWSVAAVKDSHTEFRINDVNELQINPSNIDFQGNDIIGAEDIIYTGLLIDLSDERQKTDIADLDTKKILDQFMQVEPITFKMKNDPEERTEYGVIAQQVEPLFPDLVITLDDEEKTKSMNYVGMIAPMIEVIQHQQKQIEALQGRIRAQEERLKEMSTDSHEGEQ